MRTEPLPQPRYLRVLSSALEDRCAKNPRYSLRAFSRDLGISSSRLSGILSGKFGLSPDAFKKIAVKIGLSEDETEKLVLEVAAQHSRNKNDRKKAAAQLESIESTHDHLSLESFKLISDWYHLAILELTLTKGFRSDPDWIAKRLGISVYQVEAAIERMKSLDLIETRKGKLRSTGSWFVNPKGIPSDAIRKFHSEVLGLATQSLTFQSPEKREFLNLMIATDPETLTEVKRRMREFHDEIKTLLRRSRTKKRLYNFSMQFFALDSETENERKIK